MNLHKEVNYNYLFNTMLYEWWQSGDTSFGECLVVIYWALFYCLRQPLIQYLIGYVKKDGGFLLTLDGSMLKKMEDFY
jgi:hypothetical protein